MELKTILKNKKAMGVGDIYPIVLTIAIVGILLAVLLMIMAQWQDITNNKVARTINESLTTMDELGEYVDNHTVCGFSNFVVEAMVNDSMGVIITSGNYTANADTGQIIGLGDPVMNGSSWNVTYTYSYGGEDCEAMQSITSDFVDFIPWIGIILLIVAAAIVLGIVIKSFSGTSRV